MSRFTSGGRTLERLAGTPRAAGPRAPRRWRTDRTGPDLWGHAGEAGDQTWLREPIPNALREGLQTGLLFPLTRVIARPRVVGASELMHVPQPAIIAPNHSSDIDTPLILAALPRAWRSRTVVGAAADRFYRKRGYAVMAGLWINTFPFDRGSDLRGLGDAARLLRSGKNVLLYPQSTRSAGQLEGFRAGVARLAIATGAPLLPVFVGGTAIMMPKGRGLIQRGRATVVFGRPIFAVAGEHPHDLAGRAQAAIADLAHGHRARRASRL